MPDKEELEQIMGDFLDAQDTARRRDRLMPWKSCMQPTPESDAEEWDERSGAL